MIKMEESLRPLNLFLFARVFACRREALRGIRRPVHVVGHPVYSLKICAARFFLIVCCVLRSLLGSEYILSAGSIQPFFRTRFLTRGRFMNFDSTLDGKVAVVTGAGRGIGEAIACAYAGAGAAVCAAARTRAEIDSTAEKIRQAGGSAISIVADVRDPDSVQHLVDATVREFGGLDIFVVNAGVHLDRSRIEDSDPELWKETLETNLMGAYH